MSPRASRSLLLSFVGFFTPLLGQGQSATELLNAYSSEQSRRLESIQDVHMVEARLGTRAETFLEKAVMNGQPFLETRLVRILGEENQVQSNPSGGVWRGPLMALLADGVAERAEIYGAQAIEGQQTVVLDARDLAGLELGTMPWGEGGDPFRPTSVRFWLDTDDWLIRRAQLSGYAPAPEGAWETTITVEFTDFRDTEGFVYPFRTVFSMSGFESRMQPQEVVEQLRSLQVLESTPEGQAIAEAMLREDWREIMEALDEVIVRAASGPITLDSTVETLTLNQGIPAPR